MPLYALTVGLYFWVPALALGVAFLPRLDPAHRRAFWLTAGGLAAATVPMERFCLDQDIWNFWTRRDPLLGWAPGGAPVEEFLFWFGAAPFVLGVYLAIRWLRGEFRPRTFVPARRTRRSSRARR